MEQILFKPNLGAVVGGDLKSLPAHSHRRKLSWQWLNAIIPPAGETGEVVREMAGRRDMKMNKFANRRQLFNYLVESRIPPAVATRVQYPMWESWSEYLKARTTIGQEPLVLNLSPKNFRRAGIHRKDLAVAILRGFMGNIGDPEGTMESGGRLADSAFQAAQAVIELVESWSKHSKVGVSRSSNGGDF